ncbi:MAG: nucleotidyltransferase domain-containing protein, partial [Candidatus Altiarchaeales archaeon]|nr:nucleotidyltransferase domain-containing protein [Candidatus Altiarchaeales archaeon]
FYSLNLDNPIVRQFKIFLTVIELNPLTERIKKDSKRIILFGSCSEGTDVEESDIDLFILAETGNKKKVRDGLSRSTLDRRLSPIIINSNEFVKLKREDKPLYERIMKGIELSGGG